jgi:hypothetical protein
MREPTHQEISLMFELWDNRVLTVQGFGIDFSYIQLHGYSIRNNRVEYDNKISKLIECGLFTPYEKMELEGNDGVKFVDEALPYMALFTELALAYTKTFKPINSLEIRHSYNLGV